MVKFRNPSTWHNAFVLWQTKKMQKKTSSKETRGFRFAEASKFLSLSIGISVGISARKSNVWELVETFPPSFLPHGAANQNFGMQGMGYD